MKARPLLYSAARPLLRTERSSQVRSEQPASSPCVSAFDLAKQTLASGDARLRASGISLAEGEFLHSVLRSSSAERTIEIGCAFGISSLFICDAIREKNSPHHVIVDPNQSTEYGGQGIARLKEAQISFFELIEKPSEVALPRLLEEGRHFDFGFVDGYHTFDHTLLDFYYLDRLIPKGGYVVIDDNQIPPVAKAIRYIARYPNYRLVGAVRERGTQRKVLNSVKLAAGVILYPITRLLGKAMSHEFLDDSLIRPKSILDLDYATMVGFQKVADDARSHIWFDYF